MIRSNDLVSLEIPAFDHLQGEQGEHGGKRAVEGIERVSDSGGSFLLCLAPQMKLVLYSYASYVSVLSTLKPTQSHPNSTHLILTRTKQVRVSRTDSQPSDRADVTRKRDLELPTCEIPDLDDSISGAGRKPLVSGFNSKRTNPTEMTRNDSSELPWSGQGTMFNARKQDSKEKR